MFSRTVTMVVEDNGVGITIASISANNIASRKFDITNDASDNYNLAVDYESYAICYTKSFSGLITRRTVALDSSRPSQKKFLTHV